MDHSEDFDQISIFYARVVNSMTYKTSRVDLMSKKRFMAWMEYQRLYEMFIEYEF